MKGLAVLALACAAASPVLGGAQEPPQAAYRMIVGKVSTHWDWEPIEQPVPPPHRLIGPQPTTTRNPGYTPRQARRGYRGHVIAEATIGADGRLGEPRIVRSPGADVFNAAVLGSLQEWTFRPATRDGEPVAVTGIFSFTFTID